MSSTIIGLGVSLLFVIILVGGFLVGFWRGFKRSSVNLIFSVVGVIVAFFVTPLITNAILGIKVEYEGSPVSLQNILLEMLLSIGDLRQMVSANKNLEILVTNLPGALCNVIMFILVTIAIEIVMYIIYKICNFTFLKGAKGGRLFGGLVGVAKAFIVTIIAFMPLAGLIGFAKNMTTANDFNIVPVEATAVANEEQSSEKDKSSSLIIDQIPEQAVIIVKGLENNFLTKCSSIFGLDNAMFDYYASTKVDGGRVKIRKEIENVYQIADFGYQMGKHDLNNVDFAKINYDKVIKSVDELTDSGLFKYVVSQSLSDLIINYEKYSFLGADFEYKDILIKVGGRLSEMENASTYFRNDMLNAFKTVKTIGKSGIINEIIALDEKNEKTIANLLTNDKNIVVLEEGINNIFKLNIIKDSISSVMQRVIDKVSVELDKIGVDGSDISENGWKEISKSLTNIVKDMGIILNEIDLGEVIDDPTILLDKEKNYNLNLIMSKIGDIVDEVRANKLLQTKDNKPIVDKFLAKQNLSLPTESVLDNDGNKIEIKTYKKMLEFVVQSVETVRNEGIFDIVVDEKLSNEEKISTLANLISTEGKKNLLSDIILPLYQVEFTNKLVIEKITEVLNGNVIDLNLLNNYNEWKSDLSYISDILVALNSGKIENKSFLTLALEGNIEEIINNIEENDIDNVFNPLLSAKSTKVLKDNIFEILSTQLSTLAGKEIIISAEGVSFAGAESQTQEICNILKKFVAINKNLDGGLKNIDRTALSQILETMKLNAYRTTLSDKTEEGIFKGAYEVLVESFNEVYNEVINVIANNQELLKELGVENLNIETLLNIDFDKLVSMIDDLLSQNNA